VTENRNTTEPQKPRRRWFQFRLRTLLIDVVVVGGIACRVAHESRIVAARKAFECSARFVAGDDSLSGKFHSPHPENGPSALRRWLGDEKFATIHVYSSRDLPAAEALFPEAKVLSDEPAGH